MILQHLIFPQEDICDIEEMYFRDEDDTYSSFTFFNMFSLDKWYKYTDVCELKMRLWVEGTGDISLVCYDSAKYDTICTENVTEAGRKEFIFDIPVDIKKGILFIKYDKGIKLLSGCFFTDHEITRNVNIAVGICTYKREDYVLKTINTISKSFVNNPESELYGHIKVYVSDNGHTLKDKNIDKEYISIKENKNAGGSSGFARCMVEAIQEKEKYKFTNFIFMDDDILIDPESIYRTFAMLSYIKKEYVSATIGGALLRKDIMDVLHASGEVWNVDRVRFTKRGLVLSRLDDLLKSQKEQVSDYNGWWYTCVPLDNHPESNLPLPLFIHMDDIEYGIRLKSHIIYLNGVSVWHDAFDHRKASSAEYYDMRNLLIMNAVHHPEYSVKQARKRVVNHLIFQCLKYRYLDMELTIKGVEDFCKGIDFLKETDPVLLHNQIAKKGYPWEDMTETLNQSYPDWKDQNIDMNLGEPKHSITQKLFLNGWLIPTNKRKALPMGVPIDYLFHVKNVIYYDPETGKGFQSRRKYREWIRLLKNIIYVHKLLKKNYHIASQSYRTRVSEITNIDFWREYLEL